MKIGKMLWGLHGLDYDFWQRLDWIKKQGFEEVSFHSTSWIGGVGFDITEAGDEEIARLRSELDEFSEVDIHAPFPAELCLNSPYEELRQAGVNLIGSHLQFAERVGAKTLTIHAGDTTAGIDEDEKRKNWMKSLKQLDELADGKTVKIGAEITRDYGIIDELGLANVGITLDIGHMCFNGGEGYREDGSIGGVIRCFGDGIVHMHIHDFDFESELDHIAIGSGGIDFEDVVGALKEIHYAGSLCLELNSERVTLEQVIDSKNRLEKIVRD